MVGSGDGDCERVSDYGVAGRSQEVRTAIVYDVVRMRSRAWVVYAVVSERVVGEACL